jgi:hypothetical protein
MLCRDLDEAYYRKRALAANRGANGHLALADWCLRQSLVSRAADELLEAMTLEPRHPYIPFLEKRVQASVGQNAPRPKVDGSGAPGVSLDELERTVRQLPVESVERFTSQVQPLLINRCGASSCHGDKSESEFHLVRGNTGQTLLRRFTQRNLHAVLQNVNRDSPAESLLLKVPAGPHGPLATAVFRDADKQQWRLLTEWVQSVKTDAPEERSATAVATSANLMQASFLQPVPLPGAKPDKAVAPVPAPAAGSSAPRAVPPSDDARSAPPAPPPFHDPFDPALFNRRRGGPEPVTPK